MEQILELVVLMKQRRGGYGKAGYGSNPSYFISGDNSIIYTSDGGGGGQGANGICIIQYYLYID